MVCVPCWFKWSLKVVMKSLYIYNQAVGYSLVNCVFFYNFAVPTNYYAFLRCFFLTITNINSHLPKEIGLRKPAFFFINYLLKYG